MEPYFISVCDVLVTVIVVAVMVIVMVVVIMMMIAIAIVIVIVVIVVNRNSFGNGRKGPTSGAVAEKGGRGGGRR